MVEVHGNEKVLAIITINLLTCLDENHLQPWFVARSEHVKEAIMNMPELAQFCLSAFILMLS